MEISDYIDYLKKIQNSLLSYLDNDDEFDVLNKLIDNHNLKRNKSKLKDILVIISVISQYHHRKNDFFNKIEKIINYLEESIKSNFTNIEIFKIFRNSKRILLYLFQKQMISMNKYIANIMTEKEYYKETKYPLYFLPEIKQFISNKDYDLTSLNDIIEKRKKDFDDNHLNDLIRNDSLDQFIIYINETNLSLEAKITPSINETNSFLIDKNPTLIEYAAFFGSVRIFNYLKNNNVLLIPSLWIYSVYGRNHEIIETLKENNIEFDENCYLESIKCHHNEIAIYLKDNYIKNDKNYFTEYIKYHNINLIEETKFNESEFFDFCQFDYQFIVEKLLDLNQLNINKIIRRKSHGYTPLHISIKNENIEIIKLLLGKPEIDPNITNGITGFNIKHSPLSLAVSLGNVEIVKLLLECQKVDVNLKSIQPWYGDEKTPLIIAVEKENVEIIKLLLEKTNINVNCDRKEFVLLNTDDPTNKVSNQWDSYYDYKTPLLIAIQKNNFEIVKMLLNCPTIDINKICKKENLYYLIVNKEYHTNIKYSIDGICYLYHPYYSKYLTEGYRHLYFSNEKNNIKEYCDMPFIIKNSALSLANKTKNDLIINLLKSNANINQSFSYEKKEFIFYNIDKKLIAANSMLIW